MKWYLADAIACALDEKREHPEADFPKLVDQFWAAMQQENAGLNSDPDPI